MIEQLDTGDNRNKTQVLRSQLFQHAPTMETCIVVLIQDLPKDNRNEESQERQVSLDFRRFIPKIISPKVDATPNRSQTKKLMPSCC